MHRAAALAATAVLPGSDSRLGVTGTQENREKKTGVDQGNQGTTGEKVASFVPGTDACLPAT